jgi:squalene synthase HpnC
MTATAASPLAGAPTRAEVMAQASSENFPVALRLLGERRRSHLLAIYGFARLVDDAGDEASGDRLALLDSIEADLDHVFTSAMPQHPVLCALVPTVRQCQLPDGPFRRLIEANRRDQVVHRYRTFAELIDYCQLSAAPVGELVLHVFGAATPDRIALSDRICNGLQITEHLQDIAEDYAHGRVYIPQEDLVRYGCSDEDLAAGPPGSRLVALLGFQAARARSLLAEGAPLIRRLRRRDGLAVVGFVAGGRAALDALADARYDVLARRPRPSRRMFAAAVIGTIWEQR